MPPDGQSFSSAPSQHGSIHTIGSMTKIATSTSQQIKFVGAPSFQPSSSHQKIPDSVQTPSKIVNRFSNQVHVEFIPSGSTTLSGSVSKPYTDEVQAGSKWWSSKLKQQDLSQHEVNAFEQALRAGMIKRCEGHWYPTEPLRGSGHRSIVNDLTIDPLLVEAAGAARIRDISSRLPRAILWLNPGSVRAKLEDERFAQEVFCAIAVGSRDSSPQSIPEGASDEDL